ncbi:CoA pyrophosphatase [Acinetobacter sp. MD2]|uniref:CoA pyrophosphatase n=1 Tax=Acinetobacter sp. MD2 TaxID=2600066 RepID=UPI002D1E5ED1|nr:CoA pyrophosphatase [Acinetobacter sp. MD2]MEB3768097.1 CoA pyrophosphatase [Acinetobacter sp. MD2]
MQAKNLVQHLQQQLRFTRKNESAQAAVLVAITREAQPKVLLTRRSLHLSKHAGEVSFPGGKRDLTDASNIAVALREAEEETGLLARDIELIGDLPMQQVTSGITVKPVVGLISSQLHLVAEPNEIDRIFFASLQQLIDSPATPYAVQYAEQTLYFPSMRVENEIVWGLTARILVSLFKYGLSYEKDWPFLLNARNIE